MSVRKKILLVTPPMTQLNTPYPATPYLTGFLRGRGYDVRQADAGLDLALRLLSRPGLEAVLAAIAGGVRRPRSKTPPSVAHFLAHAPRYLTTVEPVVRFLQRRDPTLAWRIASEDLLPRGPRFAVLDEYEHMNGGEGDVGGDPLEWAFGALGVTDRAQHLASLYLDDLFDVIRDGVDPRFELSRYAEKLASSAASFGPILDALAAPPTLVDRLLDDITRSLVETHEPDVVGFTLPFPGNVYGGFRMAREVRRLRPAVKLVMGGGYVNTELRELAEPRVFDLVDFITLDDGEAPLLALLEHLESAGESGLFRTLVRGGAAGAEAGAVVLQSDGTHRDVPMAETGTPTYDGLRLDRYLSVCELLNPMHRLWSDGRWNKLTLAHGCYWKKCAFCDVTLDYIGRYDAAAVALTVDRMEALIAETGESGFHFVDEAAPPKLLDALAGEITRRGLTVTFWTNIRFEKTFTPALAAKLAAAGCLAVSGGLEVASDRLLELMAKGVTVEQGARGTPAFTEAGILVHAYLMHGFPTETLQDTVDALERVRQLFAEGCIQSAFWHRFAATVHSPVGQHPERFGVRLLPVPSTFARNEIAFVDPTGTDHDGTSSPACRPTGDRVAPALRRATYNFMHGAGFDQDVRAWFDFRVPRTTVPGDFVRRAVTGATTGARRPEGKRNG